MPDLSPPKDLRQRLANTRTASDRLYRLSFLNKLWLASYVADVDVLADYLDDLLETDADA